MTVSSKTTRKTAAKPAPKLARKPAKKVLETAAAPAAEFPQVARDYATRAAEVVLERATKLHDGAEKATAALEMAATGSVTTVAQVSRDIQNIMFDDAKAAIAAFENTIAAASVSDAARVQADYFRAQFDLNVSRAKNVAGLVAEVAQNGAKIAQDNFGRLGLKFGKAA
jgi:hypothetical protein